jgi:ABC-2 type transport system permease protein
MYSIVNRASLLRKLSFPRLVIPLSATLTSAITFAVNTIVVLGFIVYNRIVPGVKWLLLVPLTVELLVFTFGVGLILATLFVRYRDVAQVWELMAQLLFYASPIIIPVTFLPPWFQPLTFLNPFVQIMQDVRAIVVPGDVISASSVLTHAGGHALPVVIAIGTLALGLVLFRKQSPWFAERS